MRWRAASRGSDGYTGENEGRGVVGWTGVAAARFRGEDPALQALEFVRNLCGLDESKRSLLGRYFPITTLDRLLGNKDVRALLGINVKENKLLTGLPAKEAIKPLKRIVMDLAEKKINVSGLKNSTQQLAYINGLPKEDKPDLTKLGSYRAIEGIKASELSSSSGSTRRRSPSPVRRTVIPPRLKLNVTDPKSARIFNELQTLKAEDTPNAGAVLLRVFLELSVDCFLDKRGIATSVKHAGGGSVDKKLAKKVEEAIDELVKAGANRKHFITVVRGLSVTSSPFSIDLLHAYVHNRFVSPKSTELLTTWDDAQPFFEHIWK